MKSNAFFVDCVFRDSVYARFFCAAANNMFSCAEAEVSRRCVIVFAFEL